jgi:hypothetical protein
MGRQNNSKPPAQKSNTNIEMSEKTNKGRITKQSKAQPQQWIDLDGVRRKPNPNVFRRGKQENNTAPSRSNFLDVGYDGANHSMPATVTTYIPDVHTSESTRLKDRKHSNRKRPKYRSQLGSIAKEKVAGEVPKEDKSTLSGDGQLETGPNRPGTYEHNYDRKTFQYLLPDCDTVIATSEGIMIKHNPKKGQKDMSYVHDFTGSPINRAILEYYDREEMISQENSKKGAKEKPKGSVQELDFADPTSIDSESTTSQHGVADYMFSISKIITPEHQLGDCTPVISTRGTVNTQHSLDRCDTMVTWKNRNSSQHTPDNCISKASSEGANFEHGSADCPLLLSENGTTSPGHNLGGAASKTLPRGSIVEHVLGDCTSIASINGAVMSQHALEDCRSSITLEEHPSLQHRVPQHDLYECQSRGFSGELSVAQSMKIYQGTSEHTLNNCASALPSRNQNIIQNTEPTLSSGTPNLNQHTLAECDPISSLTSSGLPQHSLDECELTLSPSRSPSLPQHNLSEDNPANSTQSTNYQQYFDGNRAKVNIEGAAMLQLRAFGNNSASLPSKRTGSSTKDRATSTGEHNLDDCSNQASTDTNIEEHGLADCSPRASMELADTQEHPLADCSPDANLSVAANSENGVSECSPRGSLCSEDANEYPLNICSPRPINDRDSISRRSTGMVSHLDSEAPTEKQEPGTQEHHLVNHLNPPISPRRSTLVQKGKKVQDSDVQCGNVIVAIPTLAYNDTCPENPHYVPCNTSDIGNEIYRLKTKLERKNEEQRHLQSAELVRTGRGSKKHHRNCKASDRASKAINNNKGLESRGGKSWETERHKERSDKSECTKSRNPSETSITPSIAQQSLAQILAVDGSKRNHCQLDGTGDSKLESELT